MLEGSCGDNVQVLPNIAALGRRRISCQRFTGGWASICVVLQAVCDKLTCVCWREFADCMHLEEGLEMDRTTRRRVERELSKIMKSGNDTCSICRKPFEHNSRTFGGVSLNGETVLTGECCAQQVDTQFASGLYVKKNYAHMLDKKQSGTGKRVSLDTMTDAVAAYQSNFSELDALSENVMKKAGVQIGSHEVNLADSPWKSDDALWFKNHPNRSHRLRPMFDGEAATIPSRFTEGEIPEGYGREILVRQVDVGQRIRTVLCRNMEAPMPDSEEVIHAIFDTVTQRGENGIVSIDEIMALARKYGISNAEQLN